MAKDTDVTLHAECTSLKILGYNSVGLVLNA